MNMRKLIIAFVVISAITTYVYLFDIELLKNVDTINHFLGGVLLAALLRKKFNKKNPLHSLAIATFVFFGWELVEIYFTSVGFYPKLFEEPVSNRIQDLVLDFLGFISFYGR